MISDPITGLFHYPLAVSFHTKNVKRCEFFIYGVHTEDCNLYESDAEEAELVEDTNSIYGPRICPSGEVMDAQEG